MAGKKNGKQAPESQVPETQAQPQAQGDGGKGEKPANVFLNRVSEKMIRPLKNTKDGKDWTSVSFGITGPDGNPAIGSVLVRSNQVMASTRKGPNGERVPNPGFKNVLLGQPNQHYNVSLNVKDANGQYIQQKMSAEEIRTAADEANKAYRASKKAEKGAKDAPDAPANPSATATEKTDEGLEA